MIVRIATEGQYLLPDSSRRRLNDLDDAAVAAVEARDRIGFGRAFSELLAVIRLGDRLSDHALVPSDLIVPPPQTTLEEAMEEFTGEGLIPDQ